MAYVYACCAFFLLLSTPLGNLRSQVLAGDASTITNVEHITTVEYDAEAEGAAGKTCTVGPLGWTCNPNDTPIVETTDKSYPTETNFVYELQEECCTEECVTEKFEAARATIIRMQNPSHEIYVDRKLGVDTYGVNREGTRNKPFKTLSRAYYFIDMLRYEVRLCSAIFASSLDLVSPLLTFLARQTHTNQNANDATAA